MLATLHCGAGPAVFGWERWREHQAEFSFRALVEAMEDLVANGTIRPAPPTMAAHLVLAALNEAALLIAHAPKPQQARIEIGEVLRSMVNGLRAAT